MIEMIGTGILMVCFNLSKRDEKGNTGYDPVIVSLTVFILSAVFGNVSGGHFNPAISVAVLIFEGLKNIKENT